ncbi:MAG: carboxypeptidase regulatory-like domain-containing protein [Cytophagaceae bacterium]|jgi:hypothetical protein|nr:carboxypeptidase regulatory-like domain-containing protein [Cytophagaceae bacterium]
MRTVSTIFLAAMMAAGLFTESLNGQTLRTLSNDDITGQTRLVTEPVKSQTAANEVIYYENFEVTESPGPDFPLPEGWTTVATPNYPADIWHAGTLGDASGPIYGMSGMRYGYIVTNTEAAHDAWTFTPEIDFIAGKTYDISFYVRLHGNYTPAHYEALEVKIGTEATAEGMTTQIYEQSAAIYSWWQQVTYRYTATETGEHYIGFHSTSPSNASIYASFIEDVKVEEVAEVPSFDGATFMSFGNVQCNLGRTYTSTYYISNKGIMDLTVNLTSKSDELTITDLPLTLPPQGQAALTVELNLTQEGAFNGSFVLETNDPNNESVTVDVTATGTPVRITNYNFEDFESGAKPLEWATWSFSVFESEGVDGSKSFRGNPVGEWGKPDLVTHYVDMGATPRIGFYYKAVDRTNATPVAANGVIFRVQISNDFGATYNTVYSVEPDGANEHVESADYAPVDLDVSDYAGQKCLVKIIAEPANGSDYWFYLDNMSMGTRPVNDLAAVGLQGEYIITADETATYTVSVKNTGTAAQTAYSVKLMKEDGTQLAEVEGTSIASDEVKTYNLTWKPEATAVTAVYAEVILTDDEDASNNQTAGMTVLVQPVGLNSIAIGSGNATDHYIPIYFSTENSATQTIYYPYEIGTNGGIISGIVYKTKFGEARTNKPVQIWLGETETNNLQTGFVNPASFTKVFDGTVDFSIVDGAEVPVSFTTPYNYQGGNLVVYICKLDANHVYSYGNQFYVTPHENSSRSRIVYGSAIDPQNPDAAQGTKFAVHVAPNIKLLYSAAGLGELKGTVTDGTNPLAGVKIDVVGTPLYKMTGADGSYSFTLTSGTYEIVATLDGYAPQTVSGIEILGDDVIVKDITIHQAAIYKVSGVVTDAASGLAIENAKVKLTGYNNYQTVTDAMGAYEFAEVYGGEFFDYEIEISAMGYITQTAEITVAGDITHSVELLENPYPVRDVTALENVSGNQVLIQWTAPGFTEKNYILDDNSAEDGYRAGPNFSDWYGNKFIVDESGILTSIDVYGFAGNGAVRTTTVDIFDEDRQLLGSSEPFELPSHEWINVPLDNIPYSGAFYAMVHWSATAGSTNYLGLDNNGPSINANAAYFRTGDNWYPFTESHNIPAVFMVRANANSYGSVKFYGYSNAYSKSATGYIVYRLEEGQPEEEWSKIASVTDTEYFDDSWATAPAGVYQYAVKAEYFGENNLSVAALSDALTKVEETYTVSLSANPAESGSVTGDGEYTYGATTDIIATAHAGYNFVNWTENDEVVSALATYTITVESDRTLVANFTKSDGIDKNTLSNVTVYGNKNSVCITNSNNIQLKSVRIIDMFGRTVHSSQTATSTVIKVDRADGYYVVQLITEDGEILVTKVYLHK